MENPIQSARPNNIVLAWFLASRPRSFVAALAPVVAGLFCARRDLNAENAPFLIVPAICCLGFALFAQIATNFINDYADFKNGVDLDEKDGPVRSLVEGWISPRAALVSGLVALATACLFGLFTIPYGGRTILLVGLASSVACVAYSYGPAPLAYIGLGDLAVVLFFGIVPVAFTYYLQLGTISTDSLLIGLAIGLACDNILVANNYRDRDHDRAHNKRTLIALCGERFGRLFYLANGLLAVALMLAVSLSHTTPSALFGVCAVVFYAALHWLAFRRLQPTATGGELTRVYEISARNLMILALVAVVILVF